MNDIRFGYSMRDIDEMARSACVADRSMASDMHTRFDVAWSAIAEHLCAADQVPELADLVRVGWQAIYSEVRAMRHTFGQVRDDPNAEVASGTRFVQYWHMPPVHADEGLVERLAAQQILDTLGDVYREAVVALAVHDDYGRAADALGLKYSTLTMRISVARKEFRHLWFAPEPAPSITGTDRRIGSRTKALRTHCNAGHELTPDNVYCRPRKGKRARTERVCRMCERERSARRSRARAVRA